MILLTFRVGLLANLRHLFLALVYCQNTSLTAACTGRAVRVVQSIGSSPESLEVSVEVPELYSIGSHTMQMQQSQSCG